MYCPKCNQQQASEEMRFCSRCGFPLAGVALLLEHNGMIPEVPREPVQRLYPSRKKIIIESAIFTLVAWSIGLFTIFWFDFGGPLETVAKIAALLFSILGLLGLIRFLYGFLFAKDVIEQPARNALSKGVSEGAILEAPSRFALPPQQSLPASDYPRRVHTKEMLPQPSVTENTTRLIDEQTTDRSE